MTGQRSDQRLARGRLNQVNEKLNAVRLFIRMFPPESLGLVVHAPGRSSPAWMITMREGWAILDGYLGFGTRPPVATLPYQHFAPMEVRSDFMIRTNFVQSCVFSLSKGENKGLFL